MHPKRSLRSAAFTTRACRPFGSRAFDADPCGSSLIIPELLQSAGARRAIKGINVLRFYNKLNLKGVNTGLVEIYLTSSLYHRRMDDGIRCYVFHKKLVTVSTFLLYFHLIRMTFEQYLYNDNIFLYNLTSWNVYPPLFFFNRDIFIRNTHMRVTVVDNFC